MKVLITGSASHLARVVLPVLCARADIDEVIGIDLRPSDFTHPHYREHHLDIRDARLGTHLAGMDALVHMAFVVMPGTLGRARHDRALIRDINLHGSAQVFTQARHAGVAHCVHLSSAVVYGAWSDNPPLLDEHAPRRAMPGFIYAEDKVAVEDWLDAFEAQANTPRIVRLRPHVILGPHAQPLLRALLRQPFYPRLPNPQPLSQCVWEDDVAEAISLALDHPHSGIFNIAADPALSFRDMQRARHALSLPLPFSLARTLHRMLWRISGFAGEPAWFEGLRHTLAVDCRQARHVLGWRARRDTHACLRTLDDATAPDTNRHRDT